jgi:hypothetical protein
MDPDIIETQIFFKCQTAQSSWRVPFCCHENTLFGAELPISARVFSLGLPLGPSLSPGKATEVP